MSDVHSFVAGMNYQRNSRKNQGVGGFNLPERGTNGKGGFNNFYFRHYAILSDKTLIRTHVEIYGSHEQSSPVTNAIAVEVLGAFTRGGSQNVSDYKRRGIYVGNVFSRAGPKLTM